ncbi:uncharacterized protein LOC142326639 isoform X2 [Lycorma delicatula]|uniref:uncharacterized protein LOC142326639 isoform X2 n=1 Tax=Lycorma delicatula TaxID=130591 RepID=UPI003F50F712
MSGYSENTGYNQDQFWSSGQNQESSYSFDVPGNQFGQELNFQSFPESGSGQQNLYSGAPLYGSNPYLDPSSGSYGGELFTPSSKNYGGENGVDFDDEPPLLEGACQTLTLRYCGLL